MKTNKIILSIAGTSALAVAFAACSPASTNTAANVGNTSANAVSNTTNSNPNQNTVVGNTVSSSSSSLATPKETANAFFDGIMNKDEAAVRRTVSKKIQTEIDQMLAKAATDPEMKKRGITDFNSMLSAAIADAKGEFSKPEIVSEQINGETAVLQIKSSKSGATAPMTFVREAGEWKVAGANENAAAQ